MNWITRHVFFERNSFIRITDAEVSPRQLSPSPEYSTNVRSNAGTPLHFSSDVSFIVAVRPSYHFTPPETTKRVREGKTSPKTLHNSLPAEQETLWLSRTTSPLVTINWNITPWDAANRAILPSGVFGDPMRQKRQEGEEAISFPKNCSEGNYDAKHWFDESKDIIVFRYGLEIFFILEQIKKKKI